MTQRRTTRSQTRDIAERLVALGQDLCGIAGKAGAVNGRDPAATAHAADLDRDPSDIRPGVSAHRRLDILARCQPGPGNPVTDLDRLIAHIPPLLGKRQVCLVVGRELWNGHRTQDLMIDGACLTSSIKADDIARDLYAFVRTNENIELGPDPVRWTIDRRPNDCPLEILADCPETAAARFASCSAMLRKAIQDGVMPKVFPSDGRASEHLQAIVSRRLPAPRKAATAAP